MRRAPGSGLGLAAEAGWEATALTRNLAFGEKRSWAVCPFWMLEIREQQTKILYVHKSRQKSEPSTNQSFVFKW